MTSTHTYQAYIEWTGNKGTGTSNYRAYGREHLIYIEGKPTLQGSSDPAFRGDASKHNPEDLFVSAVSACHMLTYLHLCVLNQIVVTHYEDRCTGIMKESDSIGGQFTEITLRPLVRIQNIEQKDKALELHEEAHRMCFIANSVNFPIKHVAEIFASGS